MRGRYFPVATLLVFTFLIPFPRIQGIVVAQTIHLSDSTQRVVFDGAAFGADTAMPQWSNGYLVWRQVETFQADIPNVRLYDKSGSKTLESAIWFTGSQRVLIYSAVATRKGEVIASGHAEKANGVAVPFIALTDTSGTIVQIVQTTGFVPMNICQAPDGTVWSFGGTGYDGESRRANPGDTLRHFDLKKGELSSYIPRSTFVPRVHPGPEVNAYIRCLTHEVVAYSPSARELIELQYDSNAPRIYQVQNVPPGVHLAGFAAIDSKRIYGHYSHGNSTGLYALSFDDSSNTVKWNPVEGTVGTYTTAGVISGLWGEDGGKLLVSHARDQAGEMAIHWTTPLD